MNALDAFEEHRGYLFSIAYRLLGSVSDAEDVLQEAFLRWDRAQPDEVRSARAFLATIVVRLCMDELRSARARREVYVGPWLPEPLVTTGRSDLTDSVVLRESLSFAFLLMLEKLSPVERAVFVLREVFDYDYAEIAPIVGKTEANCRQAVHRARQRLASAGDALRVVARAPGAADRAVPARGHGGRRAGSARPVRRGRGGRRRRRRQSGDDAASDSVARPRGTRLLGNLSKMPSTRPGSRRSTASRRSSRRATASSTAWCCSRCATGRCRWCIPWPIPDKLRSILTACHQP